MKTDDIHPETWAAYGSAIYWLGRGRPGAVMRVDADNPLLASLYRAHGATSALFITACNPYGEKIDDAVNAAATEALGEKLRTLSPCVLEGMGGDEAGIWGNEESFLALGIDHATALSLGREFRQDAVLHAGADAIWRLVRTR